jgi:hypothetical protein
MTFIFEEWYLQKVISKKTEEKKYFLLVSWRSLTKRAGSWASSGSLNSLDEFWVPDYLWPLFLQKSTRIRTQKVLFHILLLFFSQEDNLIAVENSFNWYKKEELKFSVRKCGNLIPKLLGIAGSGSEYNEHGSATLIQLCIFSPFTQI